MKRMFRSWLHETKILQTRVYGYNFETMKPASFMNYLLKMTFAAGVEVAEMAREFSWKPWAIDIYLNRDALVEECVDVMHFIGNVLVALDVTDDELNEVYSRKMQVNKDRQKEGYKAQK